MGGDLPGIVVIFGMAGLALTLTLSRLTAGLIAGLSRVPIHFGLDLEPDNYGPPWVAVWLAPGLQLGVAALMVVCILLHLPTHGDPVHGALLASGCPAFVQGVFYVLLRRWRGRQN
jgi:hypothetical protein